MRRAAAAEIDSKRTLRLKVSSDEFPLTTECVEFQSKQAETRPFLIRMFKASEALKQVQEIRRRGSLRIFGQTHEEMG